MKSNFSLKCILVHFVYKICLVKGLKYQKKGKLNIMQYGLLNTTQREIKIKKLLLSLDFENIISQYSSKLERSPSLILLFGFLQVILAIKQIILKQSNI